MNSGSNRNQRWIVGLVLAGIAVAMGVVLLRGSEPPAQPSTGALGERRPALAFALKDSQGRERTLAEFKGKAVIVHFWASWCPPCVEEIPTLLEFARSQEKKPFALVLVGLDQSWDQAWTVLPKDKLPANAVAVLDPKGDVANAYGSFQYPESYLLDPEQKIVIKWVGMQKWGDAYFAKSLDKALAPPGAATE